MSPATPVMRDSSATLPILARPSGHGVRSMRTSQLAYGQSWVWLFGGALVICLVMILGLLFVILRYGLPTFWPKAVVAISTHEGGRYMGEIVRDEHYRPEKNAIEKLPKNLQEEAFKQLAQQKGESLRQLIRIGNFEFTQSHHRWISDYEIKQQEYPEWVVQIERAGSAGRFFGLLQSFQEAGKVIEDTPAKAWAAYQQHHGAVYAQVKKMKYLDKHGLGEINRVKKQAEITAKEMELRYGKGSPEHQEALDRWKSLSESKQAEYDTISKEIELLHEQSARYSLVLKTFDGKEKVLPLSEIIRAYPANQLGFFSKLGVYFSRWGEFIADDPRNSNTEGGVFPCIWGTLAMTMIMTLFVVPFGVLAALYLREYAKPGLLVSTIRIAVNNLAGVPSIVFGVFGLGFFCYVLGGSIDQMFYPAVQTYGPKFGTGGLLWASLTLALLTVPVVIVATEESLAAVPRSMREGSYACGASKWQTILRIVLPRAMPGILTGMILAMARGAGEVAPLMLVGAMMEAPELPIDTVFPYVHPERSFMHLGLQIYGVGFQSPDSEAAKPMVFTITLLLILLIGILNLSAMWLRNRLRKKYMTSQF